MFIILPEQQIVRVILVLLLIWALQPVRISMIQEFLTITMMLYLFIFTVMEHRLVLGKR